MATSSLNASFATKVSPILPQMTCRRAFPNYRILARSQPAYLGLHARSIWRRHLKDKHKIPLSLQPRRTRWDDREDQPDDKKRKKSSGVKRFVLDEARLLVPT